MEKVLLIPIITNSTASAPKSNPNILCNTPSIDMGNKFASLADNHKETEVIAITMNIGLKPTNCI